MYSHTNHQHQDTATVLNRLQQRCSLFIVYPTTSFLRSHIFLSLKPQARIVSSPWVNLIFSISVPSLQPCQPCPLLTEIGASASEIKICSGVTATMQVSCFFLTNCLLPYKNPKSLQIPDPFLIIFFPTTTKSKSSTYTTTYTTTTTITTNTTRCLQCNPHR